MPTVDENFVRQVMEMDVSLREARYEAVTLRAENALHAQQIAEFAERAGDDMNALRAENAKLREALKPFADKDHSFQQWCDDGLIVPISVELGSLRAARAAIGETE